MSPILARASNAAESLVAEPSAVSARPPRPELMAFVPAPDDEPVPEDLDDLVEAACSVIAPLWPLRHFVAVNPFLGLTDRPFADAAREVERIFHGRLWMPESFYREQFARGRIGVPDLEVAAADTPQSVAARKVLTYAEAVDPEGHAGWSRLVVEEIAKWCAARFDAGQSAWKQPGAGEGLWADWKAFACLDCNPELRGVSGFRDYVRSLPAKPMDAIAHVLDEIGVPHGHRGDFLKRQLASIAGWAGHVQYQVREAAFEGHRDDSLRDLLAVRLAFDGALASAFGEKVDWGACGQARGTTWFEGSDELDAWQRAYEGAYQRTLLGRLASRPVEEPASGGPRKALQAVFCIDVRSEVLRRHLESLSDAVQTVGFAGFFGVPIEYVPVGEEEGASRCPALIAPPHRVHQAVCGDDREARRLQLAHERHERFSAMRKHGVGAFPLVETLGAFFGLRLVTDALGWTRPHENGALFDPDGGRRLAPDLDLEAAGIPFEAQLDLAEGALRNMGLTRDFAEVVLLCGHGSHTTNNPYASGLDCGACGGHRGDVNARVASALLDSPRIRAGLAERGIHIPEDTRFVAGLHDTTRDTVELLDAEGLEDELRAQVEAWLEAACARTREERAPRLGERPGRGLAGRLRRRAWNWSEVRPEWGLAGNAAFIAAPRARTRGLDLEGRVFLHDYDAAQDEDGSVLELILSAPLVVASWINLQYYASTVDNDTFGSGDKALHNVVGRHGVMLGNRSDLKTGLPWQSVHDGCDVAHEPMRLTAIVEAPHERIARVLGAHGDVRTLVDHGWITLVARDPVTGAFHRWVGGNAPWVEEPVG